MNEPTPDPAMEQKWAPITEGDAMKRFVRRGIALVAVATLAAAIIVAFVSIINVVGIWFEYQYVPIARAVLAMLIAAAAVAVLVKIVRK